MILFYSDYCSHCRMLIETIKTYDKEQKIIKPVSIDVLRNKGKQIPSNIKSVPSLLVLPEKTIKTGKEVFDYLLLPGSGILLNNFKQNNIPINNNTNNTNLNNGNDLISFSFGSGSNGFSDNYSLIDNDENDIGFKENSYAWANINDNIQDIQNNTINMLPIQEETRKQRDLLDIDQLRIQREMDLKESDLNKIELPISKNTRDN